MLFWRLFQCHTKQDGAYALVSVSMWSRLRAMLFGCALCLLAPMSSPCVQAAALPPEVLAALRNAGISPDNVGVVVQRVDDPQPLIRHNASQAMNPASVMKLVTTYAALELLGPSYAWQTEALEDAAGNLYLRGSGDPRLTLEQFWLLLRKLRARGVRDIAGDLVLDRSAFALPPHDPAAFDGEPLRPYNVGPDALLVNFKSLHLTLRPDMGWGGAPGVPGGVLVLPETPSEGLQIVNRLQRVDGACGDWRENLRVSLDAPGQIGLAGRYAASCGDKALFLAPWATDVQVEGLFRALWRELGGSLRGKVRAGAAPVTALPIAVHESSPLAEIVRDVNKYSNNVMARQVFLTLDAIRPATPEGARRRVGGWLNSKGLDVSGIALDNGSGLSRSERISADALSRLLLAAWHSPVMPELMASLPILGVDGTLKKRMNGSAQSGRGHLKTGYLEGVRALAGYVLDSGNRRWVLVFLINDAKSLRGKPAMDAMLRWIAVQ